MKGLGLVLLAALLVSVALIMPAGALKFVESQKEMALTIEQGGSAEFTLLLIDLGKDGFLVPEGEIDDWISFGNNRLDMYEYKLGSMAIEGGVYMVNVTVDVPEDAEAGEYEGTIDCHSTTTTQIALKVRVVPSLEEVRGLQAANEELQATVENMTMELSETRGDLQDRIAEISSYQQNMTLLEGELEKSRNASQELENKNVQLTGQVMMGYSGQFIIGLIIGIIIIAVIAYRASIRKAFGSAGSGTGSGGYKGWKP